MDIMIDIETLSTDKTATIVSIGAVVFDPKAGGDEFSNEDKFYTVCDVNQQRLVDVSTVTWWMSQSDAAREVFTDRNAVHITAALQSLKSFIEEVCPDGIWANSPSFDLRILEDAFRQFDISIPWMFWQERDVRTLKNVINKDRMPEFEGTAHNALADAAHQVKQVQYIHSLIGD